MITENQIAVRPKKQCRYLKPDGVKCRKVALAGEYYCFQHGRDRRHARNTNYSPAIIEVPLLDNRSAIQSVVTDIVRAILAGTIDPATSGRALYGLQIASAQLSRLQNEDASAPVETAPAVSEPVEELTITPEGEELGPEVDYLAPENEPAKAWDFSVWLYRQSHPDGPLPESGWVVRNGKAVPKTETQQQQPQFDPLENESEGRPNLLRLEAVASKRSA